MACTYKLLYNPFTKKFQYVLNPSAVPDLAMPPVSVLAKNSAVDVPADTKTTVVTITAAVDTYITKVVGSGDDQAKWGLVVDTVDQNFQNTDNYAREWDFAHPWKIPAGSILDLKVEHPIDGEQLNFAGTIWGYT